MIAINKMEAFSLVSVALDNEDEKAADAIMNIIFKSIKKGEDTPTFSNRFIIKDKKDEKILKRIAKLYGITLQEV